MAQRKKILTCNWSVVSSTLNKGSCYFLEQETLPSLLSTSWFQEQVYISKIACFNTELKNVLIDVKIDLFHH